MPKDSINVGVVGVVSRGAGLAHSLRSIDFFNCHAVCDTNAAKLEELRAASGAAEAYTDYQEMLEKSDLQAVIVGTPMFLHAPMTLAALNRGLHVLCEVTPAISLEECRQLVAAARRSKGIYMLAENYTFMKSAATIRGLVEKGLFGTTYYAEGEYLHDVKALNVETPWRRHWQMGINGITYGTHSLGPVLQWFPGQRVTAVSCVGSGHHYRDEKNVEFENEDTCVMLCKTSKGGLIKIRVDLLSDRPHAMTNYSLQGTDGAYESSRALGEPNRIWLRSRNPISHRWEDLQNIFPEHTPAMWKDEEQLKKAGHGGGDFLELLAFRDAILGRAPNDLGIHQTLDMALPGLVSQQSILQAGAWLPVPDSREWDDL